VKINKQRGEAEFAVGHLTCLTQWKNLLPSEKVFAYKVKLEAMKRQNAAKRYFIARLNDSSAYIFYKINCFIQFQFCHVRIIQ